MNYSLENDKLKITARSQGGEITSITEKSDNTEYLWNGNPKYWKYHAPVLFPIVGKVNGGKYTVDGKIYELPQHGLARTSEFALFEKKDDEITFELKYSDETLKVYPYKFSLKTNYKLEGNIVKVTYTVENIDDKKIYFSIGSHPAFMCPIDKNDNLNDCYIEFNTLENCERIKLTEDGYLSKERIECLNNTNRLYLTKELFKDDALVFDNLTSTKMTIKSDNNNKALEVDYEGFPYMGIWSPKDGAPFVCIEPWFGHADYYNFNDEFKNKEGIIGLDQGKTFECTFKLTVK